MADEDNRGLKDGSFSIGLDGLKGAENLIHELSAPHRDGSFSHSPPSIPKPNWDKHPNQDYEAAGSYGTAPRPPSWDQRIKDYNSIPNYSKVQTYNDVSSGPTREAGFGVAPSNGGRGPENTETIHDFHPPAIRASGSIATITSSPGILNMAGDNESLLGTQVVGGKGSPNQSGTIMLALQKIIDILEDINGKIDNLTGKKGLGGTSIPGIAKKDGGGATPDWMADIAALLALLMTSIGAGLTGALGKVFTDLAAKGAEATKDLDEFATKIKKVPDDILNFLSGGHKPPTTGPKASPASESTEHESPEESSKPHPAVRAVRGATNLALKTGGRLLTGAALAGVGVTQARDTVQTWDAFHGGTTGDKERALTNQIGDYAIDASDIPSKFLPLSKAGGFTGGALSVLGIAAPIAQGELALRQEENSNDSPDVKAKKEQQLRLKEIQGTAIQGGIQALKYGVKGASTPLAVANMSADAIRGYENLPHTAAENEEFKRSQILDAANSGMGSASAMAVSQLDKGPMTPQQRQADLRKQQDQTIQAYMKQHPNFKAQDLPNIIPDAPNSGKPNIDGLGNKNQNAQGDAARASYVVNFYNSVVKDLATIQDITDKINTVIASQASKAYSGSAYSNSGGQPSIAGGLMFGGGS